MNSKKLCTSYIYTASGTFKKGSFLREKEDFNTCTDSSPEGCKKKLDLLYIKSDEKKKLCTKDSWTIANCKSSCDICPDPTTTEKPTEILVSTKSYTSYVDSSECKDWYENCKKEDCTIPSYDKYCPVTCKKCNQPITTPTLAPILEPTLEPTPEPSVDNNYNECKDWLDDCTINMCDSSTLYLDRCKETCNTCTDNCTDVYSNCSADDCDKEYAGGCRKTCNKC